jgi:hypothetical protein
MLIQWRDSRVVNCCSTIIDTALINTRRRVGLSLVFMKVPRPLKQYHWFMFGVDKGHQRRMHLGGFTLPSSIQEGELDCRLCS